MHLDLKIQGNRAVLVEYARFRDLSFELQIRTTVQDSWSVLDHKIKYKRNIPDSLRRRINRLAALFELADQEFVDIRDETLNLEASIKGSGEVLIRSALLVSSPPTLDSELNAFSFSRIAERHFQNYIFDGVKIDGFVGELKKEIGRAHV